MILTKELKDLIIETKRGLSSHYFKTEGSQVKLINFRDVVDGRLVSDTISPVFVNETNSLAKIRIEPGDVIVTIKGSSFKAGIAGEKERGAFLNANLIAFTPSEKIVPELIVAYLNSPKGQQELQTRSAGITQKFLSEKALLDISIPVPPMEKQKLLAAYLQLSMQYSSLMEKEKDLRRIVNDKIIQIQMGGEI